MTTLALPIPSIESKYFAVARVALRQRWTERAALLARALFYALVLAVFARIWSAISGPVTDRIWYLAISQWIVMSQPRLFNSIERDVRSGDVACLLVRPMSYLYAKLAEGIGELVPALLVLGLTGAGMAFLLSGGPPSDPIGLLAAVPLALLASIAWQLCVAWIGVTAFWLQDCAPLYWLWQKLAFVLGGLFIPLELYPEWLRTIALISPFSALINGPASMVLRFDPLLAWLYAAKLCATIAVAWYGLQLTYARALRELEQTGG